MMALKAGHLLLQGKGLSFSLVGFVFFCTQTSISISRIPLIEILFNGGVIFSDLVPNAQMLCTKKPRQPRHMLHEV